MSNISDIIKKNINDLTTEDISDLLEFAKSFYEEIPEKYSYDNILKRLLASVPDNLDKRTGAIIYDALAPCAGELANMFIAIQIFKDQTYIKTAKGDNLDRIGEQYSVPRLKATKAQRIAEFIDNNDALVNLPLGSRFSVPESDATITYQIIRYLTTGKAVIECEQYGTIGNEYFGDILPLFSVNDLKSATIIGTQQPARDKEIDDDYSERIIEHLNHKGFGGNIKDYQDYVESINGTSKPKVFPIWNGGGTVKLSILDSQYNALTNDFINQIKETIDPTEYTGLGVGIAPIGHQVTVVTPTEITINISATLTLDDVTISQVKPEIEQNIEKYLFSVRKNWVDNDYTNVYLAQIISDIVKVSGIINATNVQINGSTSDISYQNTATNQYIPVLGEVTLSEQS